MITVAAHQGRLIEVRFAAQITPEDMKGMRSALGLQVVRIAVPVLFAADVRTCEPLAPEILPMVVGLMRSDNRSTLRSGVLFRPGSPLAAQLNSALGEPMKGARKACFSTAELLDWLREVATPAELAQARVFLAEIK